MLLLQIGNHVSQDFSRPIVGEQSFKSAPDFDPELSIRQRKKDQNASVVFFMPYPPHIEK